MPDVANEYLNPTPYFDFNHPEVVALADTVGAGISDPVEIAVRLYYAVRDRIRYNPYTFSTAPETLRASHALRAGASYCIPKAVLLGALARRFGIPSRLGLADVKNHLASPQLIQWLRTDLFAMHGYIELHLEGKWVQATPAFNKELCAFMGVPALEFDGQNDSVFQKFTPDGKRHMEYVHSHGTFADVPYDYILENIRRHYPHIAERELASPGVKGCEHSLEADLKKR